MSTYAVWDGHEVQYREYVMAPTTIFIQDQCYLGLPDLLTAAQLDVWQVPCRRQHMTCR